MEVLKCRYVNQRTLLQLFVLQCYKCSAAHQANTPEHQSNHLQIFFFMGPDEDEARLESSSTEGANEPCRS